MLNNSDHIRVALPDDAQQCLNVYRYYVENTAYSFEEGTPTADQMSKRINAITSRYPWLVYEKKSIIRGYAYASQFRPRPAYRWTVEVTIYLDDEFKGTGIAACLYQQLFEMLVKQGFYNAIAVITEPNPVSEKFHQKMGFAKIGTFKSIGFKLGQWHDIGWWQRRLWQLRSNPLGPDGFSELDDA